jgi:hypothetical protein
MKKIFLSFFILLSFQHIIAQAPSFQWGKSPNFNGWAPVCDIKLDNAGNVYITGCFNNTVDFDPGPSFNYMTPYNGYDIYIVKLNATGNFVWAEQIDYDFLEQPADITVDASGMVYVCGAYWSPGKNYSGFVTKMAPGTASTLATFWNYKLRDTISSSKNSANVANSVDFGPTGDIYVGGTFNDTIDIDQSSGTYILKNSTFYWYNSYLCRIGSTFWGKTFSTTKYSRYNDLKNIMVDNSGNVYCGGLYYDSTDFDPGPGINYVPIGNPNLSNGYLTKLDPSGNLSWVKTLVGGAATTYTVRKDNASNIFLYGGFGGTVDFDMGPSTYTLNSSSSFFATKVDPSANFNWAKSVNIQTITCADIDGFGNTYLSGMFSGTIDADPGPSTYTLSSFGNEDEFIVKLDANGDFVWAGQIGTIKNQRGFFISANSVGEFANYGTTDTIVDVDPGPLTFNATYNDYILKFVPGISSSIKEINNNGMKAFPNPTNGQFNLFFEENLENAEIKITNSLGQIILQKTILSSARFSLNIYDQPSGIYIIDVSSQSKNYKTKIIKE